MSSAFETLNPAQREAVEYDGGPLLVVAGAGSGTPREAREGEAWSTKTGVSYSRKEFEPESASPSSEQGSERASGSMVDVTR
jgi:DNA helicase-2/ATP-dependent DNA helicase PcrA